MKKVWLGIGCIFIAVLLLLQTRFTVFMRLDNNGYAVETGTMKQFLMANPNEEEFVGENVTLQAFATLDEIYRRGNSYYLGEKKKTQIDLDFPMLINGGAGILFVDAESVLFDVNYEQYSTYTGLMMSDKLAYNPGGARADANEYLFTRAGNGIFMNLTPVTYMEHKQQREIAVNSYIAFREEYLVYYEQKEGEGIYQRSLNIKPEAVFTVNGEDMTYYQLLIKLGVITPDKERPGKDDDKKEEEEIELPVNDQGSTGELGDQDPNYETIPGEDIDNEDKDDKDKDDKDKDDDKKPQNPPRPATPGTRPPASGNNSNDEEPPSKGDGNRQEGSMGVRPDSARPDKQDPDKDIEEVVPNYQKPVVEVSAITPGVYRIMLDVKVEDPAQRLHPLRKVQFEFYSVDDKGKEKLVYRSFAAASKTITAGDGAILPATKYRVNAYFTYYNEYNELIVENLVLPNDGYVTTLGLDRLGSITLKTGSDASGDYLSIPYYYDNMLVLTGVAYDAEASSDEAVYALDNMLGLQLKIKGKLPSLFSNDSKVSASSIRNFKSGTITELSSLPLLDPNTKYTYEIIAKDFKGLDIEIINNTGEFETCKARPKASIELVKNQIGNAELRVKATDPDLSSIMSRNDATTRDLYLVVATGEYGTEKGFNWADCQAYIDNGNKRIPADAAAGTPEGKVHYLYKFTEAEYWDGDKLNLDKTLKVDTLDLNVKYSAYVIGDYDLNNKRGPQYQAEMALLSFRSATLSSLGDIHINVEIPQVTYGSAVINYKLNEARTNDVLVELLHDVTFDIVPIGGEGPDASMSFTEPSDPMTAFTGWYRDAAGDKVYDKDRKDSVVMDATYFVDTEGNFRLSSNTEYEIVPDIKALYNGKEYDMKVNLTTSEFRTMRKPAQVLIKNDIFAAGTLRFDIKIDDPDDAITGNSGHVVVMNVYDYNRNFVKAVRIPKNMDYATQEITGLDPEKRYFLNFVAVEYNEGFTNATYESNKVIYTFHVTESLDISGSIKLQKVEAGLTPQQMVAYVKASINDKEHILNGTMPYYISVKKDGVDVTGQYAGIFPEILDYEYTANDIIKEHIFSVDRGEHTYDLTLYLIYNNNTLILDTMQFTTEAPIEGIANGFEFVDKISKAKGEGRFVVIDDIDLGNSTTKYDIGNGKTPVNIVNSFNGQLDFQGYSLTYDKTGNGGGIFGNIGPRGEICNGVFHFKSNNQSSNYSKGLLCWFNYGHIHDVIVNYKGGSGTNNTYWGLLCRTNASSGVIERFVGHNDPEEGLYPFSAQHHAGFISYANNGIIRDGYVYGESVFAAPTAGYYDNIYVGGITGNNYYLGKMENVYSLMGVNVNPAPNGTTTRSNYYGALSGGDTGAVENAYSIGHSLYVSPEPDTGNTYNPNIQGPAVGGNVDTFCRNVYYWNEEETAYAKAKKQTLISLESLYDYNWQAAVLGDQFDVQPVEVGYYPHVILNQELPEQELIPLPERDMANLVDLMSAQVLSYAEDGNSAVAEFRFNNPRNAAIEEIQIENLTVKIDNESVESLDGYTTLRATVSEPKTFVSAYPIQQVKCRLNGRVSTVKFAPQPELQVDFYRTIYTADDWYQYVVSAPTENARLGCDIDFAGVDPSRIRVGTYTGKLSGGKKEGQTYGYSLKNIVWKNNGWRYVFNNMNGQLSDLCVENLQMELGNNTSENGYTGFIAVMSEAASVDNVHLKDVKLTGFSYVGGLVACAGKNAVITNSSVTNLTINYQELPNSNTTGYVGGIAGYGSFARIQNCYVRNLDLSAMDIRSSDGIGGIIGHAGYCAVDSVYVTGQIEARAMYVGGVIGNYTADNSVVNLQNMIARVNVRSTQNAVGGLIGRANYTDTLLNTRNNLTGVAFGNVFCTNTDSEQVSYTTGYLAGTNGYFYGADFQLINGVMLKKADKNTYGLLSYEDVLKKETYTDRNILNMDGKFDYSPLERECLPKLMYADGSGLLPFQEEDLYISPSQKVENLLKVVDIGVNEENGYIWMNVEGPQGYQITGVDIPDLDYTDVYGDLEVGNNGRARVLVKYADKRYNQRYYLDSYELLGISYQSPDGSITGSTDYSADPVRVPLVLFQKIGSVAEWANVLSPERNYGNYENYEIVNDLDFSIGTDYTTNVKIGRLKGSTTNPGGVATLKNIKLTQAKENLIFRLNSELSNLNFVDCSISTSGRDGVGLVGASAGRIEDLHFENIDIENKGGRKNYVGLIAYQTGGRLQNITMKDITIGPRDNCRQVGGLVGYAGGEALFTDITAENVNVKGYEYAGGIVGNAGKISMDGIEAKDFTILARYNYAGGIAGRVDTTYTATNAAYFNDITLTGTPTRDEEGKIVKSTTEIALNTDGNAHCGGLFGYNSAYGVGRRSSTLKEEESLVVDGAVIRGRGNYLGGIAGMAYTVNNARVSNTLITQSKSSTNALGDAGGISGRINYSNQYNKVDNIRIEVTNFSRVGLIAGQSTYNNASYIQAENSELIVHRTRSDSGYGYGGLIGDHKNNQVSYGTVYNCTIDCSDVTGGGTMYGVGGVVGDNGSVNRCFYYADPADADSPTAKEQYYIKGTNYVGGLIGAVQQEKGAKYSYSNANVIATKGYAGGLVGIYKNLYTTRVLNGRLLYTYSTAYMYDNYFAGTVQASDYAGGLVGSLAMAESNRIADAGIRAQGGRATSTGLTTVPKSGIGNEKDYTYSNRCFAESVTATNGNNAYAFCGNFDGFEGKANKKTTDVSKADKAYDTYFYAGTKLITKDNPAGIQLYDMKNADAPAHAKNSNTYRYKLFRDTDYTTANINKTLYAVDANVRLVLPEDFTKTGYQKSVSDANIAHQGYYVGMKFYGDSGYRFEDMRGSYFRIISEDVDYQKTTNAMGTADMLVYEGKNYLPHVRLYTGTASISDWLTRYQSKMHMALPAPTGTFAVRVEDAASTYSLDNMPGTYGTLYLSDVDTVNVEFSADLVGNGYYILYCGEEEVDRRLIEKRVYSYNYDFEEDLKLVFGYAEGDDADVETEAGCYVLSDTTYMNRSLERHVMTYGDKYYYIAEDGIWSGTGNSVTASNADSKEDASAKPVLAGDYINLYNGKALSSTGQVVAVDTGKELGTVSGTRYLTDKVVPFHTYQTEMDEDLFFPVETYSRFCEVLAAPFGVITRDIQSFMTPTGQEDYIDANIPNVKDSVALYEKDGNLYCTLLGTDGKLSDMYNGEDINAPEGFVNNGIVYMTHNLNTTAPFILVEYQNGSMAGYNYMTGQFLFDHTVVDSMSLGEYVKVYFEGNKSELSDIPATYAASAKLAQTAGTADRLASMVSGNSGNADANADNSVGVNNNGESKSDEAQKAEGEGEKVNGQVEAQDEEDTTSGQKEEASDTSDLEGILGNQSGQQEANNDTSGDSKLAGDAKADGEEKVDGDKAVDGKAQGTDEKADEEQQVGTDKADTDKGDESREAGTDKADTDQGDEEQQAGSDKTDTDKDEEEEAQGGASLAGSMSSSNLPAAGSASAPSQVILSTAGTPVSITPMSELSGSMPELGSGSAGALPGGGKLITIYNREKGMYELVDKQQFFSNQQYVSENDRLKLQNLSTIYYGYAVKAPEKQEADGLGLYILVAMCILCGITGVIWYRKKHKMKF